MNLDKELKESISQVEALRDKLNPKQHELNELQKKAQAKFYKTDYSRNAGNDMLARPRQGKAFAFIAALVQEMQDGKPISGIHVHSVLNDQINLFPVMSTVEEQKEQFYTAALGDVSQIPAKKIDYKKHVDIIWSYVEPSAKAMALKNMYANQAMIEVLEEKLGSKNAKGN